MTADTWTPRAPDCPWEGCGHEDTVAGSCIGRTETGVELWTFLCRMCHRGFTARVARNRPGVHVCMSTFGVHVKWVRELLAREHFVCRLVKGRWEVNPA